MLKKKYDINIQLVCPEFHLENTRKIVPDFKPEDLDIEIFFQKTIFQHLRFKFYKNLNNIIKKKKITHIILDIDLVSLQSFLILINSFFRDYKVCFYSNENNILNSKNIIKTNIKKYLIKFFLIFKNKILKVFCYTNQIKQNLDFCGLKEKTSIIPLGYNSEKFYRTNENHNDSKFVISYFGKIEKKKGIHTLLKALSKIKINDWVLQLDIFEIESLKFFLEIKPFLKNLLKNKKLKLIKCSHDNIGNFMQKTNLTIVPSEWNEQYGRVIQEASVCGSVVIGSNIGAIPEILIKNKFIFEPNDEDAIKNKIEDIYYNFNSYRKEFDEVEKYILLNRSIKNQAEIIKNVF